VEGDPLRWLQEAEGVTETAEELERAAEEVEEALAELDTGSAPGTETRRRMNSTLSIVMEVAGA